MERKQKRAQVSAAEAARNYVLSPEELEKLRERWKAEGSKKKRPPNPYRQGVYHYLIAALIELGVDRVHQFADVKREIKRMMSRAETRKGEGDAAQTAWERFAGKEARNEETGKDEAGRILQNAAVLQRLTGAAFGAKLLQVGKNILSTKGMVIDILPGNALRLSTDSDVPERQLRRVGKGDDAKPGAKASKSAKAKTAKEGKVAGPSKAKPKAKAKSKSMSKMTKGQHPRPDAEAPTPQPFPDVVQPAPPEQG